jgi:hypothetical protein
VVTFETYSSLKFEEGESPCIYLESSSAFSFIGLAVISEESLISQLPIVIEPDHQP